VERSEDKKNAFRGLMLSAVSSILSEQTVVVSGHIGNKAEFSSFVLERRMLMEEAITTTLVLQPFYDPLSGNYLGEPVPEETFTHSTYPAHQPSCISFFHLLYYEHPPSVFNLHARQSLCTTY